MSEQGKWDVKAWKKQLDEEEVEEGQGWALVEFEGKTVDYEKEEGQEEVVLGGGNNFV